MFVLQRIQQTKSVFKNIVTTAYRNNQTLNKTVSLNQRADCLNFEISGENLEFPYVWLRDNCQCQHCIHPSAKTRTIDWSKFNTDVKPKDIIKDDNSLQVTWDDGHKSQYGFNWLKLRSFTPQNQKEYAEAIYKPTKVTWNGDDFNNICSKHDYNELLKSDEALYDFLHKMSVYGIAYIENSPDSDTALDGIVDKIGFTKTTHYGVKYAVEHRENTNNQAYLTHSLQMHSDLSYYEYCPGVTVLHYRVQTQSAGGENFVSDAHYVAQYMRDNHPDQYKVLTDTDVEWRDIGKEAGNEYYKLYRTPIISLDKHGEITRVTFSVPQRNSVFPCSIDNVKSWYEAYGLFLKLSRRFTARFKLNTGDILFFDNRRMVHSRNGYEDNGENVRKLIGAYIDWDEMYSKLRCLTVKRKTDNIC